MKIPIIANMQPKTKKYIIGGAIGVVSLTCAFAYFQYQKIMDYVIGFKKMKVNSASLNNIDLDLFLNFTNKSNLKFTIKEQDYSVYVNDVYITKLVNYSSTLINANSTSPITLNVKFNPQTVAKTLGSNIINMMSNLGQMKLRIDMKLKVSIYFITVSIPYSYVTTLKEIMHPTT